MSSEQAFATHDLRKTAQDFKRDSNHKHKWALGAVESRTRVGQDKPRPHRPSETNYNLKRRAEKGAVAALHGGAKVYRNRDYVEGAAVSEDSSNSHSDYDDFPSPPTDVNVMYSFDASRSPTQGSQILHTALAKAVENFEERETVKLVKTEYDVLDSEGEIVAHSPLKKGKGKAKAAVVVPDADEDYEFV